MDEVKYLIQLPERRGFGSILRIGKGEIIGRNAGNPDWIAHDNQLRTSSDLGRFAMLNGSLLRWYSYDKPESHYAEVKMPYQKAVLMAVSPDGRTVVTIDPEREVNVWNDGTS
ncbi:MAG: hypothetical protein K1X57_16905 [Gemmataceae bacterium]|nr:hypothetical protein [Gemmataceae bacterium]